MAHSTDTILVVGAGSLLGRAVVARLLQQYRVVALDGEDLAAAFPSALALRIDATREKDMAQAFDAVIAGHGELITSVVYVVSEMEDAPNADGSVQRIAAELDLVGNLQRIIVELLRCAVGQFVLAGTLLVHAPSQPGNPINEASPIDPKSPLRAMMIRAEHLLQHELGAVPRLMLRLAPLYDDLGHNAFLVQQIAASYESSLVARADAHPDTAHVFLHVDDAAAAVAHAVAARGQLPCKLSLVLAEEEAVTPRQLRAAILHALDGPGEAMRPQAGVGARLYSRCQHARNVGDASDPELRCLASDHYEVDSASARERLNWRPERRILETMPRIIAALKQDPVSWYRANRLNTAIIADHHPVVRHGSVTVKGAPEISGSAAKHEHEHEHAQHMRDAHYSLLWAHYLNILLGAWLLTSPFVLGAFDTREFGTLVMQVTAERGLAPPALRMTWLGWSDMASGSLIMGFATLSLSRRFSWAQWGNACVGLWLLFAPLVFWAPSPAVYNNDVIVGGFLIAFAILVPMMPGMSMASMKDQSDLPVGWTYSPSTYLQRLPIIGLALFGFLIARQLTAYQLGHAAAVWEPFFSPDAQKNGTETIITSAVSRSWPIPDGGLGAVSYLLEVLMGAMGGRQRWRTMPWMVAAFGIVVVPLGVVSIYFIIIQPIVIGTWCTLCLIAAGAMTLMIPYTLDELVAMGQFLGQAHRRGEPVLRLFFVGGASPGSQRDRRPGFDSALSDAMASALRGVQWPWTLVACVGVGIALMFTRLLFGTIPPLADSDHLIGALVIVVAVAALAEVARLLRWINVGFGAWLVIAPWVLSGGNSAAAAFGAVAGLALIGLSLPRGWRSREHYGSWVGSFGSGMRRTGGGVAASLTVGQRAFVIGPRLHASCLTII